MSPNEKHLLRAMPKVELHCHLDGSLRVETALELAKELKVKLPADTAEGLRPYVTVSPSCQSLKEFLDVFYAIYPLFRDTRAIERVAYELCEDCAKDNIRHVEARDALTVHAHSKLSPEQYIEAALRGLRRGLKDFGVTSGFIACLWRPHSAKENRKLFDVVKRFYKPSNGLAEPSVVGMDLAGDEAQFPTVQFAEFYEEANRLGIPTTCHAGETEGTENLKAALDLQVDRIGHGTRLFEDRALLKEVIRRRVPLEIGLTSNLRTKSWASIEDHPFRKFYESGVPITLNTDNRGIIDIDLTHEYLAAHKAGLTLEQLSDISLGAADHLFLPETDRKKLKTKLSGEMSALLGASSKERDEQKIPISH